MWMHGSLWKYVPTHHILYNKLANSYLGTQMFGKTNECTIRQMLILAWFSSDSDGTDNISNGHKAQSKDATFYCKQSDFH